MVRNKYLKWSLIAVFWILLWQGLSIVVASKLLLPSPMDTVRGIFSLLGDSKFYLDATATIARCVVAIFLSLVFGAFLSVASYRNKLVRDILALPVALFKAIPIMAVAIYMILLLTAGNVPVLVCFVMCFPIVYTNLLTGLDSMDEDLLEMAKMYDIVGAKRLKFVYLPSLYPYFKSAMSLIAGMSWKAIVTAEVLSIPKFSLGYELMNSKYYLNTDLLFAYVAIIIAISVVFEKVINRSVGLLAPHSYSGSKILRASSTTDNIKTESGNSKIAVDLKSVNKKFGDKQVLKDFSMQLLAGSVTACMGASGSGKTTLIRIIAGLETADSGEVKVNAKKTSVLFQEDRLIPWLNVYDNLAIVCNDDARIISLLQSVALEAEASKLPDELSGGMKYRLAMARAFAHNGDLLLADEPFQGLDEATKTFVTEKLWKPGVADKTVFFITHSQEDEILADTTVYM